LVSRPEDPGLGLET